MHEGCNGDTRPPAPMVCHSCHSEHEVAKLCRTVVRAGTGTQWMGRPAPAAQPDADPLLGLQLGNFRLIRRIGGGGMGSVYQTPAHSGSTSHR
ncbi:MAG: hypothetical protein M3Y59_03535 [Myxococcota bacterium]|nr:hypothetical protein [Myxococcota bacterium]